MAAHNTVSFFFFFLCAAQPSEGKVRAPAPGSHASFSGRIFPTVCWVRFTHRVWGKGVDFNRKPAYRLVYIVHKEYRSFAGLLLEAALR